MKLSSAQVTKLDEIRHKHGLSLILLHGSQADGSTHAKSDIDVAIMRTKKHESTFDLGSCITDLMEVFGSSQVDVSDLTRAHPLLLKTVTDKAVLLSGQNRDLVQLKLRAFHRYLDYQPYFQIEHDTVRRVYGVV